MKKYERREAVLDSSVSKASRLAKRLENGGA